LNKRQVYSNFFYSKLLTSNMLTKREEQFLEDLEKWAQSIGINLDRDPEQL